ncbi:MAG: helix-turn-helix domain-containing protein, partial [Acidobacteria bacterium]|nr:helix-turn-helix domain-containing protein [Acidobacteriota bacterium]
LQPQNLPPRLMRTVHPARHAEPAIVNLGQLERRAIRTALELAAHDKTRAARLLGIGKTTLYRKLKEMTIEKKPGGTPASGDYLM